jgi:hypothetical protein
MMEKSDLSKRKTVDIVGMALKLLWSSSGIFMRCTQHWGRALVVILFSILLIAAFAFDSWVGALHGCAR